MPLLLATPEVQPAVELVAKEICGFEVDLRAMTAQVRFAYLDAEGKPREDLRADQVCNVSLVARDAKGNATGARFTPEEYALIKAVLYRLTTEDGFNPQGDVL